MTTAAAEGIAAGRWEAAEGAMVATKGKETPMAPAVAREEQLATVASLEACIRRRSRLNNPRAEWPQSTNCPSTAFVWHAPKSSSQRHSSRPSSAVAAHVLHTRRSHRCRACRLWACIRCALGARWPSCLERTLHLYRSRSEPAPSDSTGVRTSQAWAAEGGAVAAVVSGKAQRWPKRH